MSEWVTERLSQWANDELMGDRDELMGDREAQSVGK